MSTIFGHLNLNDTDYVFNSTVGQRALMDAIEDYLARRDHQIDMLISVFVDSETENFKERFKLTGTGRMQDMGFDPVAGPAAQKVTGQWDVAYPLTSKQTRVAWTRISQGYYSVMDLERHVLGVEENNKNSVRFEILKAMFNNTQRSFSDPNNGTLSLEPFANGDTVTYPPVIGAESEATDDHYLESGYAAANISDTNNPYKTIEAELTEHFGRSQGNNEVAVFIHSDQKAVTEDLTDFVEVIDRFVIPGTQTATLTGLPTMHPGRVIGRTNGCWVIEWDWIPTGYMLGVHMGASPPLKRRIDPATTGFQSGLRLVHEDENFPFEAQYWENRYGYAVGNRLNGVVMELGTGGTYTIPTIYA